MCSRQCLCVQLYVRHAICAADNAYVYNYMYGMPYMYYDTSSCCWLYGPLPNDMCHCLYWLLDFTTLVVNVGSSRDHMTNLLGPHRSPDHKSGLWPSFVATAGRILPLYIHKPGGYFLMPAIMHFIRHLMEHCGVVTLTYLECLVTFPARYIWLLPIRAIFGP